MIVPLRSFAWIVIELIDEYICSRVNVLIFVVIE